MKLLRLFAISILAVAAAALAPGSARADDQCSGHNLLPKPRPAGSCATVKPQTFVSPDKKNVASVVPADVSLNATPDMESRVVIRSSAGSTVNSKDYSSPRGDNGYYVFTAQWSPDLQYFVYSMMSSGGHSPWSFPIAVYGLKQNLFVQIQRHDQRQSDDFRRFQILRPAYARCQHLEAGWRPR